jgi:hypothetical protein
MIFAQVLGPLKAEVEKLMARSAATQAVSPH